ncbi:hypothetical protein [Desulfovirgula thermocuniculi]|uniref:hypothetical protein n=1 Tax=Desulfovirgula thermocuniculi TaxID=348842 RepID=UPI000418B98E|nr:hypothetical protein [Desulfovirgula thermocuniculi]
MRRVSFALNDDRGFSLASVVVAVAFLAVAAALVGALLADSVKAHRASAEGQTAAHLALAEAERLKAVPFDELTTVPEGDVPGYPGFRAAVEVEQVNAFTKRVTVRVTYPVQGGERGEQRLTFERTGGF